MDLIYDTKSGSLTAISSNDIMGVYIRCSKKTGMETLGPMSFSAARYLIGSIGIVPIAFFEFRKNSIVIMLRGDRLLALKAFGLGCFMFCGISLQQIALQYTKDARGFEQNLHHLR